jgi:RNA polymerase sigma factor (sigma-70 family)
MSRLSRTCVGSNVSQVDASLIERLRRGDPTAFDQIYRRHAPGLFAFLARLCGRPAIAEELLQETWLRLATHARRLPVDVNLAAWLFTVARNLYRSHRRWRLVDLERLRSWRHWIAASPGGPSPLEAAVAHESERQLEAALAALPVSLREMILLVAVERFSPSEAAAITGITFAAARQRLHRARRLLGRALASAWTVREPAGEAP